jgi:site-specific DNA recombinase
MTGCVGLYCRISVDRNGRREGVAAQEKWGREYAAQAWPGEPVRVFTDNDISAANGDHRPGYEQLRDAIQSGDVAHVWAVEQSRLERRDVEWFQLATLLDAAGIGELHTRRDGIVVVRGLAAGIKALVNVDEVRTLKKRINDRLDANADAGQPAGAHVFGYRHGVNADGDKTLVIEPTEAEAIRWAASKILAGWSLANVAAGLRERGLRGVHGGRLNPGSVRRAVTSPTIAGRRVHRGKDLGEGTGNWEPILDESTRLACAEKLTGDRTVTVARANGTEGSYTVGKAHRGHAAGRKYVLTGGLAICGVCSAPLVGTMKQRKNDVTPYLICHPTNGGKACVGIMLEPVEALVVDSLWAEVDRPEFLDAVAKDEYQPHRDALADSLRTVERQRAELASLWSDGDLTAAEWRTARDGLTEREQTLRAELRELPPPLVNVDISTARESWPLMTLDERREFLRLFISSVTIQRAVKGTSGFDPNRVTIEWRKR